MNSEIQMHDLVALLEEVTTKHFVTGAPLTLPRGQIGTVVMTFEGSAAYEVEFCDAQGRTFAMLDLPGHRLIHLHDSPEAIAA